MATTQKHAGGRPSKYTEELGIEICALLASGMPVTKIVLLDHMPSQQTVYTWLRKHPEFLEMYEIARQDLAHTMANQIQEIIDEKPLQVVDEAGNIKYDSGSIADKRLRMDGRKWLAAKYLPRVYGERTVVAGDETNPVAHKVSFEAFDTLIEALETRRQAKAHGG
jgi:hypothetical protein